MGRKRKDLTGMKINALEVLRQTSTTDGKDIKYLCRCDCKNEKEIWGRHLKAGQKSCGCMLNADFIKHNLSKTRLHKIWRDMISRCYSETDYHGKWYGERGITICDEWQEFLPFYEWAMANGYAENLTIERNDNNKGYSPDNCCWKTTLEQCHNRGLFSTNKSGYSGIYWRKDCKKWRATITVNYKKIPLENYENIEDAIVARKEAEIKYWGKDAE